MNVKKQAVNFDADQKLLDFIDKKVGKLETFYDKIVDAEVFLKTIQGSAQVKDKIAELKLNIPGKTLFASGESKSFEESVDMSVESVRKQLQKHKEKNR